MPTIDDYVTGVLMRDLVGHDKRPVSFLVYVWLAAEEQRRNAAVQISYRELAESIGVSKSSAQASIAWLVRRKLVSAAKATVTATPEYKVQTPWRRKHPPRLRRCPMPVAVSQPHAHRLRRRQLIPPHIHLVAKKSATEMKRSFRRDLSCVRWPGLRAYPAILEIQ